MPALYGSNSASGNPAPQAAGPEETLEELQEIMDRIDENQDTGNVFLTSFEHSFKESQKPPPNT